MGLVRTPENVDRVTAKDVHQAALLLKQLLLQHPGRPPPASCIAMSVKDLDECHQCTLSRLDSARQRSV
eukprot:7130602-Prorocentrum_lima.AAC.1